MNVNGLLILTCYFCFDVQNFCVILWNWYRNRNIYLGGSVIPLLYSFNTAKRIFRYFSFVFSQYILLLNLFLSGLCSLFVCRRRVFIQYTNYYYFIYEKISNICLFFRIFITFNNIFNCVIWSLFSARFSFSLFFLVIQSPIPNLDQQQILFGYTRWSR